PGRRTRAGRERAGRRPAGCYGAPGAAPGLTFRSADSAAADHAGDRLPAADGRTGRPAPTPGAPGRPDKPHRGSRRAAPPAVRPAPHAGRGAAARGGEEIGRPGFIAWVTRTEHWWGTEPFAGARGRAASQPPPQAGNNPLRRPGAPRFRPQQSTSYVLSGGR